MIRFSKMLVVLTMALALALPQIAAAQGWSSSSGTAQPATGDQTATAPQPGEDGATGGDTGLVPAVLANDPESVMAALKEEGLLYAYSKEQGKSPVIESRYRNPFWIYFYGCDDVGADCSSVMLHAGYSGVEKPLSHAMMAEFNGQYRYIRAFLNSAGNPRIQMDVMLAGRGVDQATFRRLLRIWKGQVQRFEDLIEF